MESGHRVADWEWAQHSASSKFLLEVTLDYLRMFPCQLHVGLSGQQGLASLEADSEALLNPFADVSGKHQVEVRGQVMGPGQ